MINDSMNHNNSEYKLIKVNLEGRNKTIHNSNPNSKKSVTKGKDEENMRDNIEPLIPAKPKDA